MDGKIARGNLLLCRNSHTKIHVNSKSSGPKSEYYHTKNKKKTFERKLCAMRTQITRRIHGKSRNEGNDGGFGGYRAFSAGERIFRIGQQPGRVFPGLSTLC